MEIAPTAPSVARLLLAIPPMPLTAMIAMARFIPTLPSNAISPTTTAMALSMMGLPVDARFTGALTLPTDCTSIVNIQEPSVPMDTA